MVRPSGEIVEQLSGDPVERAVSEAQGEGTPQTLLWDLTTAIRTAASDARIGALVIDTDEMGDAGQVEARGTRSGDRTISPQRQESHCPRQLFLSRASTTSQPRPMRCTSIPSALCCWTATRATGCIYKDALDKLSVDMHLFRVGKFKSAAEPYIRKDMSDADREESLTYLSALWRGYERAVASARKLTPEGVGQYADGYAAAVAAAGGNTAQVAKDGGLVTDLKTREQVDARVIALVGADAGGRGYRQMTVSDYLRATRAEERQRGHGAAVGVVVASGDILDGSSRPARSAATRPRSCCARRALTPTSAPWCCVSTALAAACSRPSRSTAKSQRCKQSGKPVVASMGDVAASGGYYIAAGADQIIASANSITGSIGVFAAIPTFSKQPRQDRHHHRWGRYHAARGSNGARSAAVR